MKIGPENKRKLLQILGFILGKSKSSPPSLPNKERNKQTNNVYCVYYIARKGTIKNHLKEENMMNMLKTASFFLVVTLLLEGSDQFHLDFAFLNFLNFILTQVGRRWFSTYP